MNIERILLSCTMVFLLMLFSQCENNERYYRPDLPEQLCATGIIDIDDTIYYDTFHPAGPGDILRDTMDFARSIFFEKSFQTEFADTLTEKIRFLRNSHNSYPETFDMNRNIPYRIPKG